jgi:phosphoribosylamine--glycine ligase
MNVLVVGGGGREHALCWKLAQSQGLERLFCAPGNGGIAGVAECVDIAANDIAGLRAFAKQNAIDLTVVGPEEPLCLGIADAFVEQKLAVFGPSKAAAEIEGSKAFARELCRRHKIPSPMHWTFESPLPAYAFLENRADGPIVVKASGLAAGKGVVLAKNRVEARGAVEDIMERGRFSASGQTVVLEETLSGHEASYIVLTDGRTIAPLDTARDHKRLLDGDLGPNTGGMGAVSPAPGLGDRTLRQIESQIVLPAVHALNREGKAFRGFLYAGVMLTSGGPRLLEFNCRLGDPEAQPLMLRFQSDLLPYLLHASREKLDALEAPKWDPRPAVCVVVASGGYPGEPKKGVLIHGLDRIECGPELQVFHGGTRKKGGDVVTNGGRVLGITALGRTVADARAKAYAALSGLEFEGMHYRKDIAGQ